MSMNSFHARTARPKSKVAVRAAARAAAAPAAGTRADALLVRRGLAPSRTVAQRLIEAGRVRVDGALIGKAALLLPDTAEISVAPTLDTDYVSRGGLKLVGALEQTGLDARDKTCLDIGQSTGGFTDCLLRHGAARVVGIDVGHGQLHPALAGDPRVETYEGINARALQNSALAGRRFDLIVADASFISLALIVPELPAFLARAGALLLLVKPQFEVGPEHIGKGGIVTDPALFPIVRARLTSLCAQHHLAVLDWFESPITGTDGNHEFFLHAAMANEHEH